MRLQKYFFLKTQIIFPLNIFKRFEASRLIISEFAKINRKLIEILNTYNQISYTEYNSDIFFLTYMIILNFNMNLQGRNLGDSVDKISWITAGDEVHTLR